MKITNFINILKSYQDNIDSSSIYHSNIDNIVRHLEKLQGSRNIRYFEIVHENGKLYLYMDIESGSSGYNSILKQKKTIRTIIINRVKGFIQFIMAYIRYGM